MKCDQPHNTLTGNEEYAEEYIFGRLSPDDAAQFEVHLLSCGLCRNTLLNLDNFVSLFRLAANVPVTRSANTASRAASSTTVLQT